MGLMTKTIKGLMKIRKLIDELMEEEVLGNEEEQEETRKVREYSSRDEDEESEIRTSQRGRVKDPEKDKRVKDKARYVDREGNA